MKGTEVLQKQVRSTGRKFLGRYYSGGHCDGLNSIFFSGLHVIRVVPNKRYSSIPMDQSLPPGMLQRNTEQARPAGGHFRESTGFARRLAFCRNGHRRDQFRAQLHRRRELAAIRLAHAARAAAHRLRKFWGAARPART